ncbi:hypothetical protein [Ruegeria sp. HKCCD8929]|uniref:alpha/beta hydrolase family protein n=1 Tax=Ruegeria sp. HKCCD8929 TaxID=2683006 RepID=UPI001487A7A8|nr:hypothetical protein [Ruegeria sp. HKCCD8929]
MKSILASALLTVVATAASAQTPGHRPLEIDMPHFGETVGGNIFYPAGAGGTEEQFGRGPTFSRIPVMEGAELVEGTYPLVLYSHDWNGGLGPQAWVLHGMAQRGAIGVHVDHKHTLWGSNDVGQALNHWTRVQDLSEILDHVLTDPEVGPMIDRSRIMVVGFGEGGLTALSAAGATANLDAVVSACEANGSAMRYCDEMMADDVNLAGYDPAAWNASYKLDAITSVAVIEPSLVYGFSAENVENLVDDVTLISFKNGEEFDVATDIDASGLAAALPNATRLDFNPAYRFSAALTCLDGVEEALAEAGRFPVCTDPEGSDRTEIQGKILDALSSKLGLQ